MGRAAKRSEASTPTARSRALPANALSPAEKSQKKPRLAEPTFEPFKDAAAEEQEEAPVMEEAEEEEAAMTREQRSAAAVEAWFPEDAGSAADLGAAACDPAKLAPGEKRLPFRLLSAALEEQGNGARFLRALTNVLRWALTCSEEKQQDAEAVLALLVGRDTSTKLLQRHLVDALAGSFGLKDMAAIEARQLPPDQFAEAAQALRGKQRALFRTKGLTCQELAQAVAEHACLRTRHARAPVGFAGELRKLLGRSAAEGRETWHLVRLLQCRCLPSAALALRALAQADYLVRQGLTEKETFGAAVAAAEDVVLRGFGETAGRAGRLLGGSALAEGCRARCGVQVLPMRACAAGTAPEALEAFGSPLTAVLAEGQLDGERLQLHARRVGAEVQAFVGNQGESTERNAELAAALAGRLQAQDAVLEAVLMKPPRQPGGKKGDEEGYTVVLFDLLVLDGEALTRQPLRQRRQHLAQIVTEGPQLKLAKSVEITAEELTAERVKQELNKVLTGPSLTDPKERAASACKGLILKKLDGPESEYLAGLKSSSWQAVMNPPITGAEADARLLACLSEAESKELVPSDAIHFGVVSARRTGTPEGVRDVLNVEAQFKACGVRPTWYVDAASLEGYLGLGLKAIVGGKLIPARNLALEDAEAQGKVCVQVSDDIARWEYYTGEAQQKTLQEANAAAKRAERLQVSPVAAARFILAKMRGAPAHGQTRPRLGGVYPLGNMGHSLKSEEFSVKNFILGDFFVADGSPCRFDSTMSLKEDYDFTCSHLSTHGAALRCNRMVISAKHETNAGGACSVRDAAGERERENIRILQKKWPGAICAHPKRANQVILRWDSLRKGKEAAAA